VIISLNKFFEKLIHPLFASGAPLEMLDDLGIASQI
jgi:hypothetical protein